MAHRQGFGDVTGESEDGGLKQFENGFVDVSRDGFQYAISEYPTVPPWAAVGIALATEVAKVDLEDIAEAIGEADRLEDGGDD